MSLEKLIFLCVLWRDISFEIRNHWVMDMTQFIAMFNVFDLLFFDYLFSRIFE